MTDQEQFEVDYLAAFPDADKVFFMKFDSGNYVCKDVRDCFAVWQQQSVRHEAEIADLVAALKEVCKLQSGLHGNGSLTHIALSSYAERARELLAKYEVKP
jgi:hypothetical protein